MKMKKKNKEIISPNNDSELLVDSNLNKSRINP